MTVTAAPASVAERPRAPMVSRRRRAVGLATVGAVVAVVAAYLWATGPAVRLVAAGPLGLSNPEVGATVAGLGASGATHVMFYRHDAYSTIGVPVQNAGPLPATVTGMRLVTPDDYPLLVAVDGPEAVMLAAGGQTDLALVTRFDNCEYYHERGAMLVTEVAVDTTVLGRTRTHLVTLDHPLYVRSPMITGCPDRTLDRSDHQRRP
jgi:hypothetical protein